ncbi:MAG TPA: IPT/TIG domain-containing protein [Kofleriaceae bacterium]|nr:IPT/TIG domain-containing protein [Kofleriaceae bacterium]
MSSPLVRFSAVLVLGLLGSAAGCGNDNPKLLVTGIEPEKGADGTYVRIHGNRFTADGPRSVKVYFGGQPAQIDRFASDSELIVTVPGGAKVNDVVDVLIVFDPGGKLTLPKAFRYVEKTEGPSVNDLNTNANRKK